MRPWLQRKCFELLHWLLLQSWHLDFWMLLNLEKFFGRRGVLSLWPLMTLIRGFLESLCCHLYRDWVFWTWESLRTLKSTSLSTTESSVVTIKPANLLKLPFRDLSTLRALERLQLTNWIKAGLGFSRGWFDSPGKFWRGEELICGLGS